MKGDRAAALVIKDGKILMIQRIRPTDEYYVLPGGTVEEESLEDAVVREVKEETSIDAKLNTYVGRSKRHSSLADMARASQSILVGLSLTL